jgi:hypothetical protein
MSTEFSFLEVYLVEVPVKAANQALKCETFPFNISEGVADANRIMGAWQCGATTVLPHYALRKTSHQHRSATTFHPNLYHSCEKSGRRAPSANLPPITPPKQCQYHNSLQTVISHPNRFSGGPFQQALHSAFSAPSHNTNDKLSVPACLITFFLRTLTCFSMFLEFRRRDRKMARD